MKVTCKCGGGWEIKNSHPFKCGVCGSTDHHKIAEMVLSASEDYEAINRLDVADLTGYTGYTIKVEAPKDLTCIGHLAKTVQSAAKALHIAMLDKGLAVEYAGVVKYVEVEMESLVRCLEDLAQMAGSRLYKE